jgi:hypothetical protein
MRRLLLLILPILLLTSGAAWAKPIMAGEYPWPARFYLYLGPFGYLSILCWLVAAVLLIKYRRRSPHRTPVYTAALCIALVAFVFSGWASDHASSLRTDQKWEKKQLEKKRRKEKKEKEAKLKRAGLAGQIRFAEDTEEDRYDEAGQKTEEQKREEMSVYEKAARGLLDDDELPGGVQGTDEAAETGQAGDGQPADPGAHAVSEMSEEEADAAYSYRQGGPRERAEGKKEEGLAKKLGTTEEEQQSASGGLVLPQTHIILANQIDDWNLFLSKWVLVGAIVLVIYNYISYFNSTFDAHMPLPLAGPWFDLFYPKNYAVLATARTRGEVREFLRRIACKGESFIYFGPEDPFRGERLSRFGMGRVGTVLKKWIAVAGAAMARGALMVYCSPRVRAVAGRVADGARRIHLPAAGRWVGRLLVKQVGTRIKHLYHRSRIRYPGSAQNLDLTLLFLRRVGWRFLIRAPFALLVFLILAAPTPLFFSIYDPNLYYYTIFALCVVGVFFFVDTPFLNAFVDRWRYDGTRQARDNWFVYESAWFGRACFSVTDPELATEMLDDLDRFLKARGIPRARGVRTVNIVWHLAMPPRERLLEIRDLAKKANLRLIVLQPEENPVPADADLFDEIRTASLLPQHYWRRPPMPNGKEEDEDEDIAIAFRRRLGERRAPQPPAAPAAQPDRTASAVPAQTSSAPSADATPVEAEPRHEEPGAPEPAGAPEGEAPAPAAASEPNAVVDRLEQIRSRLASRKREEARTEAPAAEASADESEPDAGPDDARKKQGRLGKLRRRAARTAEPAPGEPEDAAPEEPEAVEASADEPQTDAAPETPAAPATEEPPAPAETKKPDRLSRLRRRSAARKSEPEPEPAPEEAASPAAPLPEADEEQPAVEPDGEKKADRLGKLRRRARSRHEDAEEAPGREGPEAPAQEAPAPAAAGKSDRLGKLRRRGASRKSDDATGEEDSSATTRRSRRSKRGGSTSGSRRRRH